MENTVSYQCACAECGKVMQFEAPQAGQVVECPYCSSHSQLPPVISTVEERVFQLDQTPAATPVSSRISPSKPKKRGQKNFLHTALIAGAVAVVFLGIVGELIIYYQNHQARNPVYVRVIPRTLLAQPEIRHSKSLKDLKPANFVLEKKHGGDLAIAVGDVQNISANLHRSVRVDLDLLDKSGATLGVISNTIVELGAHQIWRFNAPITDVRVMSVRFAGIREGE